MKRTEKTISEIAKIWGKSRKTIYEDIREGKLSRLTNKKIDFMEAVRVYGEPETKENEPENEPENTTTHLENELLKQENVFLKKQLEEAIEREKNALSQSNTLLKSVTELTKSVARLEAPKEEIKKGFWGFFKK